MIINFTRATNSDIATLIKLEKSVTDTRIYSPMLTENAWVDELQKYIVYLIRKEGIVVGSLAYQMKGEHHAYIGGPVIDSAFYHQGIATQAMHKLLEELKNVSKIDLVTHPDNAIALKLYQSLGFAVESRKENYFGDGQPRLVLVLKK